MPLNTDDGIEDKTGEYIYQATDDDGSIYWVTDVEEVDNLLGDATISIRRYTLSEATDIDLISLEPIDG